MRARSVCNKHPGCEGLHGLEDNDVLDAIKESELDIVRQYLGKPNYYQDLISRQSVVDELLYNKIEQRTDSVRTSIKFITLLFLISGQLSLKVTPKTPTVLFATLMLF